MTPKDRANATHTPNYAVFEDAAREFKRLSHRFEETNVNSDVCFAELRAKAATVGAEILQTSLDGNLTPELSVAPWLYFALEDARNSDNLDNDFLNVVPHHQRAECFCSWVQLSCEATSELQRSVKEFKKKCEPHSRSIFTALAKLLGRATTDGGGLRPDTRAPEEWNNAWNLGLDGLVISMIRQDRFQSADDQHSSWGYLRSYARKPHFRSYKHPRMNSGSAGYRFSFPHLVRSLAELHDKPNREVDRGPSLGDLYRDRHILLEQCLATNLDSRAIPLDDWNIGVAMCDPSEEPEFVELCCDFGLTPESGASLASLFAKHCHDLFVVSERAGSLDRAPARLSDESNRDAKERPIHPRPDPQSDAAELLNLSGKIRGELAHYRRVTDTLERRQVEGSGKTPPISESEVKECRDNAAPGFWSAYVQVHEEALRISRRIHAPYELPEERKPRDAEYIDSSTDAKLALEALLSWSEDARSQILRPLGITMTDDQIAAGEYPEGTEPSDLTAGIILHAITGEGVSPSPPAASETSPRELSARKATILTILARLSWPKGLSEKELAAALTARGFHIGDRTISNQDIPTLRDEWKLVENKPAIGYRIVEGEQKRAEDVAKRFGRIAGD